MAEQRMSPSHTGKCAHVGCHCTVALGQQFCSNYCGKASANPPRDDSAGALAEKCRCGHSPCE
jgi:hypothetical protein